MLGESPPPYSPPSPGLCSIPFQDSGEHARPLPCPRHRDPEGPKVFFSKGQGREQDSGRAGGKSSSRELGESCRAEADVLQCPHPRGSLGLHTGNSPSLETQVTRMNTEASVSTYALSASRPQILCKSSSSVFLHTAPCPTLTASVPITRPSQRFKEDRSVCI